MAAKRPRLSISRQIVVWSLVVLATLIAFASTLTLWLNRQLLDNNAWNNASEQVIADPQVREALSVYVVNQLYANVNVAAALRQKLPPQVKPLAAPVAAALREPAARAVGLMLQRPRVQALWVNASTRAHERLIAVLDNKTSHGITTGNGVVTINLNQLVTQLGTELGLSSAVLARIPPSAGGIVLMRSSQLSAAQQAVQAVRVLSVWLLVLVLAMYATAVYIARGRRRTTLRAVSWSFVFLGVLVLAVRKVIGNYVVDALTSPAYRGTTHRVWLIATSILGEIGWSTVFYGVFGLIAVTLAGETRAARRVRGWMAPVLNERQGLAWGAYGLLVLLLILWGGTHALRTWWGVVLIGGLLAAGLVALRRQTLAEAAVAPVAPAAPPAEASTLPPLETHSAATEIARLRALRDSGSITEQEFERGKELALT